VTVETKWVDAAEWQDLVRSLTADGWWLADLCGVDRLSLAPRDGGRFEIVAQFLHRDRRERATVHVAAEGDPPAIPSIAELWPTANFMEREAFDLMGIVFEGHPNLSRIMLPDEWEGHPLRKDYGVGKVPIEFIPQPFLQFDSPHQQPNSQEAGLTVDRLGQPEVEGRQPAGGLSHFGDTKMGSPEESDEEPS
jgi:NADH-quinone oxidoreductase subunit C